MPQALSASWIFGSLKAPPRPPGGAKLPSGGVKLPPGKLPLGNRPLGNAPEGGANDPVGRLRPAAWRHCWIFVKSPPSGPPGAVDGALEGVAWGAVEADWVQAETAGRTAIAGFVTSG